MHAVNPIAEIADAAEFDFLPWFKQHERPAADLDQRLSALENISGSGARAHKVRSIVLRTEKHFSWPSFAVWLSALVHLHGDRILRVKGMLWDEEREAWIGVHCVRRFLYPPEHLLSASHTSGHTACLVFITENLDPVSIEKSYRRWVLSQAEEKPGRRGPHRNEDVSSPFHHSETPSQESPNVK